MIIEAYIILPLNSIFLKLRNIADAEAPARPAGIKNKQMKQDFNITSIKRNFAKNYIIKNEHKQNFYHDQA